MNLDVKRLVIAVLGGLFLLSLVFVQWMEVARKRQEAGLAPRDVPVPASSERCVACHTRTSPGLIGQWTESEHARRGIGCVDCHQADRKDADGYSHEGAYIATIVTPRDCARCHAQVAAELAKSRHAAAADTAGSPELALAGLTAGTGCAPCHGSKVALRRIDGGTITVDDLVPGPDGIPTQENLFDFIERDRRGHPIFAGGTWPNTGIGRINLDGSRGSCSSCHSRHDFSPRRARQPEACGWCHQGPAHAQKEIYEESKHGVAFRDLREEMKLDGETWVLGSDYVQAPTCATCHMSGHSKNGGRITHDTGDRISWTNLPAASERTEHADDNRTRMKDVCINCHAIEYVDGFYEQYDSFIGAYNDTFARPGLELMAALERSGLRTETAFDDEIEWTWFRLWHHEGRRARHGAAMMAPDSAHWKGMFPVAESFYRRLIPEARALARAAAASGRAQAARDVNGVIDGILARPEHARPEHRSPAE